MRLIDSNVFKVLFRSGGIRTVSIEAVDTTYVIKFMTGDGEEGLISLQPVGNKPVREKRFAIDKAVRLLKEIGVNSVHLDLRLLK